jgi:hypothetical protein
MRHHENEGRKRARRLITGAGYKVGGHLAEHSESDYESDKRMVESAVRQHENHEHGGRHTKLKLAAGGSADGPMASNRADRSPRGKAGKGKTTHIAIVVNPGAAGPGAGAAPPARPVPVPVPVHAPPPPMAGPPPGAGMPPPGAMPPPRPPMPPPGAGMSPPGAGGPMPMMRKSGGSTRGTARDGHEYEHERGSGKGGPGHPRMTAGSGSGEGRIEMSRAATPYCVGGKS